MKCSEYKSEHIHKNGKNRQGKLALHLCTLDISRKEGTGNA